MVSFASLDTKKNELIRKSLNGAVLVAPMSATVPDGSTLFDTATGELTALPTDFVNVGFLSEDGASFARDVEQSDITSWGSTDPTRSDQTSDITTLTMACQETNAQTIAQYVGVDSSTLAPSANGVLVVDKPVVGGSPYRRVMSIGVDRGEAGEIYVVRILPRAKVTDYDDQAFANGDDPLLWPVTYTGFQDSDLGTSERYIFGGAGWLALCEEMGLTVPTGV